MNGETVKINELEGPKQIKRQLFDVTSIWRRQPVSVQWSSEDLTIPADHLLANNTTHV